MGKCIDLAVIAVLIIIVLAIAAHTIKGNDYPLYALVMAVVFGVAELIRRKIQAKDDKRDFREGRATLIIIAILLIMSVVGSIVVLLTGILLFIAILVLMVAAMILIAMLSRQV